AAAPAAEPARTELRWFGWNQGAAEAAASKRPILVDVYTDWCGWCKRMDRDVYSREDVRGYLKRYFVVVKLDAESTDEANYGGRPPPARGVPQRRRGGAPPPTFFRPATGAHSASGPAYFPGDG